MPKVTLRYYEELNDFLPLHRRKTEFEAISEGKRSVKDLIEAQGVPHTEVDLILVNGKSVSFGYILQEDDRISVYPVFEAINIGNVTHLREMPLRRTRFIAENNLAKLARYMRALGLDVVLDASISAEEIIDISRREGRIILTMSRKLLKRKEVTHGIFVRQGSCAEQAKRIVESLDLRNSIKPFSRCLRCNSLLSPIAKEAIAERVPPRARAHYEKYSYCGSCDKIYWEGTHCESLRSALVDIGLSEHRGGST